MDNSGVPEFLSCQQIRNVDRYAIEQIGIDGLVLMENAARGCVDLLETEGIGGGVVVVCGKGNNGGDGLVIVRHLLVRGYVAKALLSAEPSELRGDALANYQILSRISPNSIEIAETSFDDILGQLVEVDGQATDWIVDALLGTGTRGEIRGPFASLIELVNVANKKTLAVDIPSGLDGDTGKSLGCVVKADLTATFVRKKSGFQDADAQSVLGRVKVLDIGIPESVIERSLQDTNSAE